MQEALAVGGQVGVDDEAQIGKVEAARRDVRGHADTSAAVSQGLEGGGSLALAHLAGQGDRVEAPLA